MAERLERGAEPPTGAEALEPYGMKNEGYFEIPIRPTCRARTGNRQNSPIGRDMGPAGVISPPGPSSSSAMTTLGHHRRSAADATGSTLRIPLPTLVATSVACLRILWYVFTIFDDTFSAMALASTTTDADRYLMYRPTKPLDVVYNSYFRDSAMWSMILEQKYLEVSNPDTSSTYHGSPDSETHRSHLHTENCGKR